MELVFLVMGRSGPQSQYDGCGKEKNSALPGIEARPSTPQPSNTCSYEAHFTLCRHGNL